MRIDLPKTIETIRWSDEPGSKEYVVRFDDESLRKMREAMRHVSDAAAEAKTPKEQAEALEGFVVAVSGQEMWDDALEYVDAEHVGAEGCVAQMLHLASALIDIVSRHLSYDFDERVKHYVGGGGEEPL